ncbi:MAG TPA: hypothetical protein VGG34_09695 [Opitutaceae bacterium]
MEQPAVVEQLPRAHIAGLPGGNLRARDAGHEKRGRKERGIARQDEGKVLGGRRHEGFLGVHVEGLDGRRNLRDTQQ